MSLLAKQEFGVPRVVARVNNPKNEWMFNELWGVDVAVSTPHLITALVEEAVSVGSFVRLLSFEGGKARLAEVRLAEGSPADGKQIVDLGVPRDATVVAVLRADRLIVPRGDTVLRVGDEVVVLVTDESEEDVRALLVAPTPEPLDGRSRDERVGGVVDHGAVAEVDRHALEDDRPAVVDAGDAAAAGEHRGDRAGPVADHHLEVRHPVARGDDHALDLAADPHRHPARRLVDRRHVEAAAAVLQPGAVELGDRGAEALAQRRADGHAVQR